MAADWRPTLYTCQGSRGLRATWAACEAGVDLDLQMLPFPPRFLKPDYLEINPLGTIPMLVDGDNRMTESCAIAHYLAVKSGASELVVKPDEQDYAAYLDFTYHADATITFPQTVYLRFAKFEKDKGFEEAGHAYAKWFGKRLIKVEQRLESREFLCADRFTVADICVGYALYLATNIGLGEYLDPRLVQYLATLKNRSGFKQAIALEKSFSKEAGIKPAIR
ncbi:glutathione S-transferase family protein [Pontixanthobacter aestiaquae]|uniref:Glutathione S-transferase family protein n=1 Tax=Pontixanthobacter aestiaquae TaxID=1509367 RepID=A0A844Z8J1_9SPHN|nr:glutathione S-transferase family protein [Pontixanthobacter aestiaquae]MDN3645186.1 glutathione S-transferase family protein [Pontixanthobacter aestiaquae]MXO83814.1 glutathione S-transferase family protein [Pontixanthobacter aestiaquae]